MNDILDWKKLLIIFYQVFATVKSNSINKRLCVGEK